MEMERGQLQPSSAKVKDNSKPPTSSQVIGTAMFSPRIELTKVHVAPLTWKRLEKTTRFRAATSCAEAVEEKARISRDNRRSESVIVSYPLTESLQRFIAKAMRQRRSDQQVFPRRGRSAHGRRALREGSVLSSLKRRALKQQRMRRVVSQRDLPRKHMRKTQIAAPNSHEDEDTALSAEKPGRVEIKEQPKLKHGRKRKLTGGKEYVLEIQPDAICTTEDSKKKNVSQISNGVVPEASDDKDVSLNQKRIKFVNKKVSIPRQTRSKVATMTDAKKNVCKVKKNGASSIPSKSNSGGSDEAEASPQLGQGASGSVPIVAGSQIEVEAEMDVFTTSMAESANERAVKPPTIVPPQESTESGLDSNLLVLDNSDFGTVVEQITLASSSDQPTEGAGGKVVDSPLKKVHGEPVKQLEKNTKVRKLIIISPKQFLGGSYKRITESLPSKPENKQKLVLTKKAVKLSPVQETLSEPKKPPCLKSGCSSGAKKKLVVRETERSEENPVPVKRPRGRPRKIQVDNKKDQVDNKKDVVKRKRGRPRKVKVDTDKNTVPSSEVKLSPSGSEIEHSVSEDSGYPSSCTNSRSPTECVLTSPIILKSDLGFLAQESFQECQSPILRDSHLGVSKPDVDGSQILETNASATESEFKLNLGMESGFTEEGSMGMDPAQSSTQNIFQDLDLLLGQDLNPDQLFNLDRNSDTTLGQADEVEDILRSPSVTNCLKDLQLTGPLPSSEVVPSMQLFSSAQSGLSEQVPQGSSTERSQLGPDTKVSQSDTPGKISSSEIGTKVVPPNMSKESIHNIPVQSKSGRKLKRTWKLCLGEKSIEEEDVEAVKKPLCRVVRVVKKKSSSVNETSGKLPQSKPPACPAKPLTTVQPSSSDAAKGRAGELRKRVEDPLLEGREVTSGLTQTPILGEQTCQPTKSQVGSVAHPKLVAESITQMAEKDKRLAAVKSTSVASSSSRSQSPTLRSFKLNLKKHSVGESSPRSDIDRASLPSSSTSPKVNAMKEPTPAGEEDSRSCLSEGVSDREERVQGSKASKSDMESSQVFTFNGFLPSSVPDKNHSLLGDGKGPSGGIFSGRLGRMGSIFTNTESPSGCGSSKMFPVSCLSATPLNSQQSSKTQVSHTTPDTPTITATNLHKHKLRLPPSNSLSMSLDTVLKQMGEKKEDKSRTPLVSKKALNLDRAGESSSPVTVSRKYSVSPVESSRVTFGEIQYRSPPKSLAESGISDLILAPLNVGETLEDELNGESLFATNTVDSGDVDQRKEKLSQEEGVSTPPTNEQELERNLDDKIYQLKVGTEVNHKSVSKVSSKVMGEALSPPMMKKICLSVPDKDQQDEEMEDCIDLFPDADDLLAEEVGEEPLSKLFVRTNKSPRTRTPQSDVKAKRDPPDSHRGHSPVPSNDGGFQSSFEKAPTAVAFKSQQVSQWVADQRKRKESFPPGPSSSYMVAPGGHQSGRVPSGLLVSQRLGNCHSQDGGGASCFVATGLPLGPSISTQESDSGYNSWSRVSGPALLTQQKYCKYYLLQRSCPLRMCRFAHCERDQAPPRVVEEMVFRQPPEKIYAEEMKPYVSDQRSYYMLINNFSSFIDMMRALVDKRFVAVINHFVRLNSINGVKFSTSFLCRLMEICSTVYPNNLPSPCFDLLSVSEKLLVAVEESRGHLVAEDYHFFFTTLVNWKETKRLSGIYRAMNSRHISPTASTLFMLLRFVKVLDDSVLPLLLDDLKCSQLSAVEKASYVNHLVECLAPLRLDLHTVALGEWLVKSPHDVTTNLSTRCCDLLCGVFAKKTQWSSVVILLAGCPRYTTELGSRVCELLHTAFQRVGPVNKLVSVVEVLTEDQIARMSTEFWETVLLECAKQNRSQKILFVCSTLYRHKRFLSKETVTALTQVLLDQDNLTAAISVFVESLQHDSSLSLYEHLVVSVSQAMKKTKDTPNLYTLVKVLMEQGMSPPPVIQETVFTLCVAEKQCQILAELVKLANLKGVSLEKGFCQKALVELRHWGRDPDSISAAYKFLRKFDGVGEGPTERLSTPSPVNKLNTCLLKFHRSTSFSSPVPSPPPPPPTPPLVRSQSLTGEMDNTHSNASYASTTMSLPTVFASQAERSDFSSIFKLIEENGSNGQFGAVASILANLSNLTDESGVKAVLSVWKGIVSAEQRSVNCFSDLLKNLDQYRASTMSHPSSEHCKPGSSLLLRDRWMISQLAIALLKSYERSENWQSGFLLLHYLHSHGIHYIRFSQPVCSLPPFLPHAPSPCEVALLAVKVCLQVEQIDGAMEVLHGCNWIKVSTDEERKKRTEMLCGLSKKCLDCKKLQEAWKCLDNIDCKEIRVEFVNMITNLHNRLLQEVLAQRETSFALSIHSKMKHCKLQCLPTVFSALLQHLCEKKQVKHARDLCKTAISEESYSPLVTSDLFKVYLSPGLVGVELHLLIENHLKRLASEVDKDSFKPLTIQFFAGCRPLVELVLSKFIKPPLQATFTSTNFATVPVSYLRQWCSANYSGRDEEKNTRVSEEPCSPPILVSQDRTFSECAKAGEESVVTLETKGATSADVCGASTHDVAQQQQGIWKDFKRAICNAVLNKIKPYYKDKFSSEEEYLHLFRVLSQNFSRVYKNHVTEHFQARPDSERKEHVLSDAVLCNISELVTDLMSKCHVYSRDLDEELGLTTGGSSD